MASGHSKSSAYCSAIRVRLKPCAARGVGGGELSACGDGRQRQRSEERGVIRVKQSQELECYASGTYADAVLMASHR